MFHHIQLTKGELNSLIKKGVIKFGGNKPLKIYGTLSCKSGKRMKKENRVFFQSETEAIDRGCRPCGHCMRDEYQHWKRKGNQSHIRVVMPTKEASQRRQALRIPSTLGGSK